MDNNFSPVPVPEKKSHTKLLYTVIAVLVIVLGTVSMWFVQQSKVDKLDARVVELEKQLAESKKKEALASSGKSTRAHDVERETDIKALHGQVEAYYAQNGRYPTFANLNDPTFRKNNMQGLDDEALKDPGGTEAKLAAMPIANAYAYAPTPVGCSNTAKNDCSGYVLAATLEAGGTYTKSALN